MLSRQQSSSESSIVTKIFCTFVAFKLKNMCNKENDSIYSRDVIEFVALGVEFCALLEKAESQTREEWIKAMLQLLPLLYAKAAALPQPMVDNELPSTFVKEEDYMFVASRVANIMADYDAYLDVFMEDMKYSDTPISSLISENIADIYQDIRNFISVYQNDLSEQMSAALRICIENFQTYWGQRLVNVLRPLHSLLYEGGDSDSDFSHNMMGSFLWD